MCGTTRARKPIGPAAAVAEPASRAMIAIPATRCRCTFTPSELATSSPSVNRFSPGAEANAATTPKPMNGSTPQKTSRLRPATEPTFQKRIWSRELASISTKAEVAAPITADNAAPPSTRFNGLTWPFPAAASAKTATVASPAPMNATTADPVTLVTPRNVNDTTTASAAPADTPKIPGSANGLRVCP